MTSTSPTNKLFWYLALVGLLVLAFSLQWFIDMYLTYKMEQICQNLSMAYSYRDSTSFYCLSTNKTVKVKEIRYH